MPLKFRRRMQATINSTKHYVHHTVFTVAVGTVTKNLDVNAVALSAVTNANDVRAGSVLKAIFVELWIVCNDANNNASFLIAVEKASGGQPDMTFAQSVNLMAYPNKKNVLYTTQGLIGQQSNNAIPIIRQWIPIPKGKQRFGADDEFRVNISALVATLEVCGITIYKEYY